MAPENDAGAGPQQDPLFGTNHFTLLRWFLAGAVLVGHAWMIPTGYEPTRIHDWTFSYLAVNGFFILSGLLIAKSLATRNELASYARSRLLRIYPAFILLIIALLLVFGPLFGRPRGIAYLGQAEPWAYVTRTLLMGDPLTSPGGVFHASPEPVFNGALWTIRYEVLAYLLAAIGFMLGALKRPGTTVALLVASQLAYLAIQHPPLADLLPSGVISLFRFTTAFLIGMVLWHFPKLRQPGPVGMFLALAAFLLFGWSAVGELLANLLLAACLMQFGLVARPSYRFARMPDYSYGIYIWHYPVLQSVLMSNRDMPPALLLAISTPLVLLCAGTSWHLVEKPALKLKRWRRRSGRLSD
ncbi:MAG: acyltransferase [Henriciella sp.]|uniref:acyltransferase family protein n=1 Tax=Henriciella sp. TaxID=1968823 RepID=UPI000C0F0BEC|nr:acyltransferase [Henriciella sp.]MAN73079.1 acyltransferase [Henriciella sp.]MBF34792.1 acyltransferase [Hyphomonadaceae bacterium]MBK75746.1 acyltransferase [Henriciella sp.]PHR81269.1 MAG: acyltransferase [Henriciella sp.]